MNSLSPLVCVRPPSWITPESSALTDLLAWVREAEDMGFDGIFVGDRMLADASLGGKKIYGASMLDSTVVLSAMAATTRRVLLGPLVMVVPFRHPVQLAKTIASLDVASGGRVVLGAGLGWVPKEFEILGVPFSERAARFEESISLMRELWTGRPVTRNGRFWTLKDVQISPVPKVGPPPIWMASFAPSHSLEWPDGWPSATLTQLDRVGRLADAWVPLIYSASSMRRMDPDVLGDAWGIVLDRAENAGRSRDVIDFVLSDWCYVLDGPAAKSECQAAFSRYFAGTWDDAQRTYTIGTREEVVEKLRDQTRAVDRVDGYVLTPLSDDVAQLRLLAGVAEDLRK